MNASKEDVDLNWLSRLLKSLFNFNGSKLKEYQRQAEMATASLEESEQELDNLRIALQQTEAELERTRTHLQQTQNEVSHYREQYQRVQAKWEESQIELQQVRENTPESENWLDRIQETINVLDVVRLPKEDNDSLWGFNIALPQPEMEMRGGAILIKGWVLGKKAPVSHVVVTYNDRTLLEIPVNQPRPPIAKKYPEVPEAENSGFESAISIIDLPSEAELTIQAVLQENSFIPIGVIHLKTS